MRAKERRKLRLKYLHAKQKAGGRVTGARIMPIAPCPPYDYVDGKWRPVHDHFKPIPIHRKPLSSLAVVDDPETDAKPLDGKAELVEWRR